MFSTNILPAGLKPPGKKSGGKRLPGDEKSATAASQLFHSPLLTSFVLEPDLKRDCN
jgi:hypothetical protein